MSEPMSRVEIEDVLSSIRRLVSQDLRPQGRTPDPARADAPPAMLLRSAPDKVLPAEDKLLLTPALRVVAERAAPTPAPKAAPEAAPRRSAPLPRLHLGVETPKPAIPPVIATPVADSGFESEIGDPYPDTTRMEWTESGWALVPEPGAGPAAEDFLDPWSDEADDTLAGSDDPDEGMIAFAEEESGWADLAEAEALAELGTPPSPPPEAAAPPLVKDAGEDPLEVVLDEQVLRDLVREILREELQGRLGERITRNIRKLVHAEMARLIAAQDLDEH